MPLDFNNSRELFSGLVEILSLAESKDILEKQFKEQLDSIYLTKKYFLTFSAFFSIITILNWRVLYARFS
jgi:hypothetical protein